MKLFLNEFSFQSIILDNQPTFHHNNKISESQIDHILYYIPEQMKIKMNLKDHLCQKEDDDNISAHDVIVGDISIAQSTSEEAETDYSTTYTEFKVKKPKWDMNNTERYQEQTARIMDELLVKFDQPEEIPILTEMLSKMFVLSAELNFETSNPNISKPQKNYPKFSKELTAAYKNHSKMCDLWRAAGRPRDASHPAKLNKLESQRLMRRIARESEAGHARKLHDELMEVHFKDISRVSQKLKIIKGEHSKSTDIPFIETLCGTFKGENVLEGFRRNTVILCNERQDINESHTSFLIKISKFL